MRGSSVRRLRAELDTLDGGAPEPDWTEAETVVYLTNLSEPELMALLLTVRKLRQVAQGFREIDALDQSPD